MPHPGTLMLRLALAAGQLPEAVRRRHAAYLASAQNADGGFSGRTGPSDLYYASFGLRGLALLGELDEARAGRAAAFLKDRLGQPMPSVDFLSLVTSAVLVEMAGAGDPFAAAGCDRRQAVIDFAERLRRADGGYAKTERASHASTYHTFLVTLCKELVGTPQEHIGRTIELIRSRQRADGGFVEIPAMRHSGTNPTAAALGLLGLADSLDEPTCSRAAAFLARMQMPEGGLRANGQIPVADLLSTFTGVVALGDLGALSAVDTAGVLRFVQSLEEPGGGFRAAAWDDTVDVEYTFYGLGAWALLI